MAPKTNKNLKPLSKGQRTYERRMKQAARQEGTVYRSLLVRQPLAKKAGEAPTPAPDTPAGNVPTGE